MRSAFTPGFLCLRHPASAKLGHPSPKDRLFLWEAALGSHVESIAEHGITPEEVESAFDNLETRGSHARQSVGRLRSAMQIPRSGDRGDFARPEDSPIGEAVLKTMIRRCIRWLIAVRLLRGGTHYAHARTD